MTRIATLFACSLVLMCVTLYVLITVPMHGTIVYDCSLAEFHPDYPPAIKQECRKLRSQRKITT